LELFPQILAGMKARGMEDVVVVAGGIIPDQDRAALLDMGVKAVFGPGTPTPDIVEFVRGAVAERD
jgi:methylmalonyl-CoA mutase C-terminal domain/subunit